MRFTFDESKIVCSRVRANNDREELVSVVEFDAHVDDVPPHVVALLTPSEKKDLELFLLEKNRLQAAPEHKIVLEALPTLIDKVRGLLISLEQIDEGLHRQLVEAKNRLSDTLERVQVDQQGRSVRENAGAMDADEALKKRLEIIKSGL